MNFRITGLPADQFAHLFALTNAELVALGAVRRKADGPSPCGDTPGSRPAPRSGPWPERTGGVGRGGAGRTGSAATPPHMVFSACHCAGDNSSAPVEGRSPSIIASRRASVIGWLARMV
jgi:hypothetical protein